MQDASLIHEKDFPMIAFDLSEDLQLMQDSARRFAAEHLRPMARAAERDRAVPDGLTQLYAELGLGLVDLPAHLGGLGEGLLATVVVAEALAFGDAPLSMALPQPGAYARLVQRLGSEAQERALLAGFAAMPALPGGALAVGQPVKAVRQGECYVLQGDVKFVLHSQHATRVVVLGQIEENKGLAGTAAFVVPVPTEGLMWQERETLLGLEAVHGAHLCLRNVRLPLSACLDKAGEALVAPLHDFYAVEGLITAARAVGLARAAYEYALDYAKGRTAFGKPVAHFQGIAFLLADMLMQCEGAHLAVLHAAWSYEQSPVDAMQHLFAARAHAEEAAFFITDNAVQILGGHGYIKDHPVEKWMRDAAALALCYGSRESADLLAAAHLLGAAPDSTLLPGGLVQPTWT